MRDGQPSSIEAVKQAQEYLVVLLADPPDNYQSELATYNRLVERFGEARDGGIAVRDEEIFEWDRARIGLREYNGPACQADHDEVLGAGDIPSGPTDE